MRLALHRILAPQVHVEVSSGPCWLPELTGYAKPEHHWIVRRLLIIDLQAALTLWHSLPIQNALIKHQVRRSHLFILTIVK